MKNNLIASHHIKIYLFIMSKASFTVKGVFIEDGKIFVSHNVGTI